MRLTNRFLYPNVIVRSVENDGYSKGESAYSATGLIEPARISVLKLRHDHELEIDVDDRIFILQGHAMHAVLERAGQALGHNVEKRYFADFGDVVISAQIDSLEDGVLTDWKNTSVYSVKKVKPEWVCQLNIQLEILRRNGLDADKLQIGAICRDWRPGEAAKDPRYPKKVQVIDIPIKPREATIEYILSRIKAHKFAETELPECNSEEHWSWRRCAGYCDVSKHCLQYRKHKGELYGLGRASAETATGL